MYQQRLYALNQSRGRRGKLQEGTRCRAQSWEDLNGRPHDQATLSNWLGSFLSHYLVYYWLSLNWNVCFRLLPSCCLRSTSIGTMKSTVRLLSFEADASWLHPQALQAINAVPAVPRVSSQSDTTVSRHASQIFFAAPIAPHRSPLELYMRHTLTLE